MENRNLNKKQKPHIIVADLTMAYGDFVIQHDLNFSIKHNDIFIIMGGSGCGKSTLLRHLIGLKSPVKGQVYYGDINFWDADPAERSRIMRKCGILYQKGALWSSMTLGENVALPLEEYTDLSARDISETVSLKLALVGLAGYEEFYPAEISGGMQKRAGLARAMALDPVSARRLDDLILELRDNLGTTVVVVTHELASIFAIGNNSVFLDADTRTMIAQGDPHMLLAETEDLKVRQFLTRGESASAEIFPG
jgi:phospholipid/cholesterol/gamma-HCH transport system ATP-binding protein